MSDVENPAGSDKPPTDGLTSTVKPAGVSAAAVSGSVVTVGAKPRCSQPVNPVASLLASWSVTLLSAQSSGCCHVFARTLTFCGPAHAVGNVNNGPPGLTGLHTFR